MAACSYNKRTSYKLYQKAQAKRYDIIIVPGVPFEDGKWSRTMKGRVLWSKYLYDLGIAKNVMYSGSSVYSPYIEAEIMAQYGRALGIKDENIFVEPKAEHSTENIYYGFQKARKLGFKTVALASDPFQTKMLKSFAHKRIDDQIGMIPIVYDTLKQFSKTIEDPDIEFDHLFIENFQSIKEREGFWERLKGTQGKKIDYDAYK